MPVRNMPMVRETGCSDTVQECLLPYLQGYQGVAHRLDDLVQTLNDPVPQDGIRIPGTGFAILFGTNPIFRR